MSAATAGWDCHAHVFDAAASARTGHYAPPEASIGMLESQATRHGIDRIVLVQPSIYGTDNSLMLGAMGAGRGRHRGVAVIDGSVTEAQLRGMTERGVRGVRFNLVSPVGNLPHTLDTLAPRLREIGWHVQWYARPEHLAELASLQLRHKLTFVLDHLAGLTPAHAEDRSAWSALDRMADGGAWIKLSGWYRLGARPPYGDLDALVARAVQTFDSRCVFGSDWPHTWFLSPAHDEPPPAYGDLVTPIERVLGSDNARRVLCEYPARLYA